MDENSKTATVAECGEPLLSPKACLKCVHCNREALDVKNLASVTDGRRGGAR